jgi:hypothetical protein
MLSVERCRAILGADAPVDDREVEALREVAYRMARILDDGLRSRGASPPARDRVKKKKRKR